MSEGRIRELEEKLADLKKRWPAHSVPPALIEQLDDLEEALQQELKKRTEVGNAKTNDPGGL